MTSGQPASMRAVALVFAFAFAFATSGMAIAQGPSPCAALRTAVDKTISAPRAKETLGISAGEDKTGTVQFIKVDQWEYFDERGAWEKERLKNVKDGQLGLVLGLAVAIAEQCKTLGQRKLEESNANGYAFSVRTASGTVHEGEAWVDAKSGLMKNAKSSVKDAKTIVHYTYQYEYGPKVQPPKTAKDVTLERQRVRQGEAGDSKRAEGRPAEPRPADNKPPPAAKAAAK